MVLTVSSGPEGHLPMAQVPVRCGDGETLTELGWALLAARIHLLLVSPDWLPGSAYRRWSQSGGRGWEMTGGRLLTGGIPGEAAVWGCSRPSTAPSVFPPPPPAAAAAALGSGNLRLHWGKPPGWCSPESGAWCPGGAAPPRAEAAKGVVCTGQPREAVGTGEQAPPPVPRSRKTRKTRTSKSLTNTCLQIGRPVTCHSWTLPCSCLRSFVYVSLILKTVAGVRAYLLLILQMS
ncbi:uncharacterized protein LOC129652970 [Bubalus kerabau]|uniref:uncharacterized protein LOC129652970 n=1 Tax=Bubalus carabanensis TaxID=3119969 RepID=UPI00244EB5D3|nr:uncharacterized protein LOC129652970 [Bubalus carabanensis]